MQPVFKQILELELKNTTVFLYFDCSSRFDRPKWRKKPGSLLPLWISKKLKEWYDLPLIERKAQIVPKLQPI